MKLVVFDLDGTLTKTNAIDEVCFVRAFAETAGICDLNTNWMDYEHVTDSGVARQVFIEQYGRPPEPAEVSRIVERFVELLRESHALDPAQFVQIPGAASLLRTLRDAGSQWGIAIATGAWEASARFKMDAAGLELNGCPAAFAEDGLGREEILRAALRRAADFYGQEQFERIVSVGDAAWDIRTAHRLGVPFLGVGNNSRAKMLSERGAGHVIEDFTDIARCLACLDEAPVPNWSADSRESNRRPVDSHSVTSEE
jgi:phosphoglycolate phosphatase-like HAD superfamily hydrolase